MSATTQSANRPCSTPAACFSTPAGSPTGPLSSAVVTASTRSISAACRVVSVRVGTGPGTLSGRQPAVRGLQDDEDGGAGFAAGPQRGECRPYRHRGLLLEVHGETAVALAACHRRRLRAERGTVGVREETGERPARGVAGPLRR